MTRAKKVFSGILILSMMTTPAFASKVPKIQPGQAEAAPMGGTYLNVQIPESILKLRLQAADGHFFTLASLGKKTIVLTNFLTSCQEICPMTSANMQKIADRVDAAKAHSQIEVLEVTVDPARDTPARLTAYQKLYGSKNWTLATSTQSNLDAIWKFFGAPATKQKFSAEELKTNPKDWQTGKANSYDVVHSDLILVISQNHWVWLDLGSPKTTNKKVPPVLKRYLTADGLKNLSAPEEPSWSVPTVLSALSSLTGVSL